MKEKHIKCKKCKGTGWVGIGERIRGLKPCPICKGKGEFIEIPCFVDDAERAGAETRQDKSKVRTLPNV